MVYSFSSECVMIDIPSQYKNKNLRTVKEKLKTIEQGGKKEGHGDIMPTLFAVTVYYLVNFKYKLQSLSLPPFIWQSAFWLYHQ